MSSTKRSGGGEDRAGGGAAPAAAVIVDEEPEDQQQQHLPPVLQDLKRFLGRADDGGGDDSSSSSSLFDKSTTAIPVAAIKALLGVVQRSEAETMMGLQDELRGAADLMVRSAATSSPSTTTSGTGTTGRTKHRSYIALQSGCELFLKYITRTFLELPDFEACRRQVLERGERFQMISLAARDRIAAGGRDFVPANSTVLTHGWSRVVAALLLEASKTKHFDLIVLEGRPDESGRRAARSYAQETNIPVTIVPDSAMAYVMERVDVVLTGAEGVLENGGIVNKLGTYALAICAHAANRPFYVAAESYKFARLYPLSQSDLPQENEAPPVSSGGSSGAASSEEEGLPDNVRVESPPVDFTPAKFITLLFTDLGVLTPSAVSDELIRLYQ